MILIFLNTFNKDSLNFRNTTGFKIIKIIMCYR